MKPAISERGIAQWLARLLWEQKVAGSTPAAPTSFNLKSTICDTSRHPVVLPRLKRELRQIYGTFSADSPAVFQPLTT